ncbi:MAG: hypothetical protein ABMA13_16075 [Chthoniobacteraceae bacterium]
MQDPKPTAPKPKSIGIDVALHGYLNLIRSRDPKAVRQMKELVEPALWEIVREHRDWLELMTGGAVEIPEPAQAEMSLSK